MATIVKNTEMVFENKKTMNDFMDRVYSNNKQKSEEVKRTSRNLKQIKNLNINGKHIEVTI